MIARARRRNTLRIASWNIENLVPWLVDDAAQARVRELMDDLGRPDVLCLQEIRVRPQDDALIARMRTLLPDHDCHASLNRDVRNATHRGGRAYGVASWIHRKHNAVKVDSDWDREGRIVTSVLPDLGLAVVNVYAVNGTDNPYWDHAHQRFEGDRHAFKRRFIEAVAGACVPLLRQGLQLVLIGDWNISRTRQDTTPRLRTATPHMLARAQFNEWFLPGFELVDAFRVLHPDAHAYTWFNRRARGARLDAARVDFALVSRALMARVVEAEIDERPERRGRSDHAPLWIELEVGGLAGRDRTHG